MQDKKNPENDISFMDAMGGVTRHHHDKADLQRRTDTANASYRRKAASQSEDPIIDGLSDEAVALVESNEELIFTSPGIQLNQLKRLKQGHIPWEQGLDLHGYNVDKARDMLSQFIYSARKEQNRCVLVVHGKSHSSESNQALIKSYVNEWLKNLSGVLAFCSAQPKDGGTGALYVLLKSFKKQ